VLRIRDVYPGSEFFPIPDPGSRIKKIPGSRNRIRIKEFKFFNPKIGFYALKNMIRDIHPGSDPGSGIRILIFYPSRIPDPGVKKAPDPGSGSVTLWLVCVRRKGVPQPPQ
jgi:hypothetical protein